MLAWVSSWTSTGTTRMTLPPPLWFPPWEAKGTHGLACGTLIISHHDARPVPSHIAQQHVFSLCFSGWLPALSWLGKPRSQLQDPLPGLSPTTCPSFRGTAYVMEEREDKSFAIPSRLQMLLNPQRGEESLAQAIPLVNTSHSKINNDISA